MNRQRLIVLLALLYVVLFCTGSQAFEGPLQVRNQFPLFMHADAPALESARTGDAFTAGLSYSSVFMVKESADWNTLIDLEMAMLELRYRKDIGYGLELGIRVPVISFNSGFMDGFLHNFHKFFGFPDYGRTSRPSNVFAYEVRRNGLLMVKADTGSTGLGDIHFSARKTILTGDPAVSLSAGLELPTGDAKRGFGNGSVDADLSVMADKRLCDRAISYFNAGIIFPGDLRAEQTIKLRESFYGGVGLEYLVTPRLGLIMQAVVQTSPFPGTGIEAIDDTGIILVYGARYTGVRDSIELSMTEDPNTSGATDFTFNLSYKRRF